MNKRQWFAIILGGGWVGQMLNLWPLPPSVIDQLTASLPAESRHLANELSSGIWLSWIIRAAMVPLGIACSVLLFRGHRKWPLAVLSIGAASVILFRMWQWLPIFYAPLFTTIDRAAERGAWLLGEPRLVFHTLIFPVLILSSMVYAGVAMARGRGGKHAI